MAPGDLDGDGDADLVVLDFLGPSHVLMNDGSGHFTDSGQLLGGEGGHGAALGDLDGDGDLDLFFVHNGDTDRTFLNDGSGTLSDSGQRLGGEEEWGTNVTLGDLDGDGDLDAYVTVYQSSGRLWINDGSGGFTDSGRSLEGNPTSVAFGDLDDDGDLDAIATYSGFADRVWLNDGAGVLVDSGQRLGPEDAWGHVVLGDIDGDGDVDAAVTNPEVGNEVWVNDGAGRFDPSGDYFGLGSRGALGDLDGDGDLDFLATNQTRDCFYWFNNGSGIFDGRGAKLEGSGYLEISLADLDGDGDLEALLGRLEDTGGNRVFINQAPAREGTDSGSFVDERDGQSYAWTQIGSQFWMVGNLAFRTQTGSWCYGDDDTRCQEYGRLYDWHTALDACPAGWRLPSEEDWDSLVATLGPGAGSKLKVDGGSGFRALMAGYRFYDGTYHRMGQSTSFWTSAPYTDDHSFERTLTSGATDLSRDGFGTMGAISVRCVRDNLSGDLGQLPVGVILPSGGGGPVLFSESSSFPLCRNPIGSRPNTPPCSAKTSSTFRVLTY
jgi:uncharacterized protein (TIGR02145 family)